MCPALYMNQPEYTVREYKPLCDHIKIVHGWEDPTVSCESSIAFGRRTTAILNLRDDNHSLSNSHEFLENRLGEFLENVK